MVSNDANARRNARPMSIHSMMRVSKSLFWYLLDTLDQLERGDRNFERRFSVLEPGKSDNSRNLYFDEFKIVESEFDIDDNAMYAHLIWRVTRRLRYTMDNSLVAFYERLIDDHNWVARTGYSGITVTRQAHAFINETVGPVSLPSNLNGLIIVDINEERGTDLHRLLVLLHLLYALYPQRVVGTLSTLRSLLHAKVVPYVEKAKPKVTPNAPPTFADGSFALDPEGFVPYGDVGSIALEAATCERMFVRMMTLFEGKIDKHVANAVANAVASTFANAGPLSANAFPNTVSVGSGLATPVGRKPLVAFIPGNGAGARVFIVGIPAPLCAELWHVMSDITGVPKASLIDHASGIGYVDLGTVLLVRDVDMPRFIEVKHAVVVPAGKEQQ